MTLVEFLTARLDEDEVAARRPVPGSYAAEVLRLEPVAYALSTNVPARPLREVEAKRAIVTIYESSVRRVSEGLSVPQRRAIEHLAAVYADHPDYQADWRPQA